MLIVCAFPPAAGFAVEKPPTGLSLVAATDKRRVKVGEPITLTVRVENLSDKDIPANFRSVENSVFLVEDGQEHPWMVPELPVGGGSSRHEALPVPPKRLPRDQYNDDQRAAAHEYTVDYTFAFEDPGVYRIAGTWTSMDLSKGKVPGVFVGALRSNKVEVEVVSLEGDALLERLERVRVHTKLTDIPLESAIRLMILNGGRYDVELDRKGLAAAGLKQGAPVSGSFMDLSVREALKRAFESAGAKDVEPVLTARGAKVVVSARVVQRAKQRTDTK